LTGSLQKKAKRRGPSLGNLFTAQKGLCYYCKRPMSMAMKGGGQAPISATRDHRTPISRGGNMTGRNVVAACFACNTLKGNMTEREFWLYVEALDEQEPGGTPE